MALSKTGKRRILFLSLGGLALGLVFVFWGRQQEQQGPWQNLPFEMELEDFQLTHGSQGRKAWQLRAKKSKYDKIEEEIRLVQPNFIFFQSETHSEVRVRSLYGRLERKEGKIFLWPRVTAEYEQTRIQADKMEYDEQYEELVFYGHVRIDSPQMQIQSENGVFDLVSRTVKLWGAVDVLLVRPLENSELDPALSG